MEVILFMSWCQETTLSSMLFKVTSTTSLGEIPSNLPWSSWIGYRQWSGSQLCTGAVSTTGKVCTLVLEIKEVGSLSFYFFCNLHLASFNHKCFLSGVWTLLKSVLEHQQPLKWPLYLEAGTTAHLIFLCLFELLGSTMSLNLKTIETHLPLLTWYG